MSLGQVFTSTRNSPLYYVDGGTPRMCFILDSSVSIIRQNVILLESNSILNDTRTEQGVISTLHSQSTVDRP